MPKFVVRNCSSKYRENMCQCQDRKGQKILVIGRFSRIVYAIKNLDCDNEKKTEKNWKKEEKWYTKYFGLHDTTSIKHSAKSSEKLFTHSD